jgi:hypothetical protein
MTPATTTHPNLPAIMAGTSQSGTSQSTLPLKSSAASRNLEAYEEISDGSTTAPAESSVADSHIRFPRDENGTTVPPPAYTVE